MSEQEEISHSRRPGYFGNDDTEVLLSPSRYLSDLPPPDILTTDCNNTNTENNTNSSATMDRFSVLCVFYRLKQFFSRWFLCCMYKRISRENAQSKDSLQSNEVDFYQPGGGLAGGDDAINSISNRESLSHPANQVIDEAQPRELAFPVNVQPNQLISHVNEQPRQLTPHVNVQPSQLTSQVNVQPSQLISQVNEQQSLLPTHVHVQPSLLQSHGNVQPSLLSSHVNEQPSQLTSQVNVQSSQFTTHVKGPPGQMASHVNIQPNQLTPHVNVQPSQLTFPVHAHPSQLTSHVNMQPNQLISHVNVQPSLLTSHVNVQPSQLTCPDQAQPSQLTSHANLQTNPLTSHINVQPSQLIFPVNVQPSQLTCPVNTQANQLTSHENAQSRHTTHVNIRSSGFKSPVIEQNDYLLKLNDYVDMWSVQNDYVDKPAYFRAEYDVVNPNDMKSNITNKMMPLTVHSENAEQYQKGSTMMTTYDSGISEINITESFRSSDQDKNNGKNSLNKDNKSVDELKKDNSMQPLVKAAKKEENQNNKNISSNIPQICHSTLRDLRAVDDSHGKPNSLANKFNQPYKFPKTSNASLILERSQIHSNPFSRSTQAHGNKCTMCEIFANTHFTASSNCVGIPISSYLPLPIRSNVVQRPAYDVIQQPYVAKLNTDLSGNKVNSPYENGINSFSLDSDIKRVNRSHHESPLSPNNSGITYTKLDLSGPGTISQARSQFIVETVVTACEYAERLKRHSAVLKSRLECQHGLLDCIISRSVLTAEQVADIKRPQTTSYEQNARLLELLCQVEDEQQHENFLVCLTETEQGHLAAYIRKDGILQETDEDRPLTDSEIQHLQVLRTYLIDHINPEDLLNEICAAKCISYQERAHLSQFTTDYKKNGELLDILQRRSYGQFKQFLACLKKTNQVHVTKSLEGDGVVTSVDAVLSVSEKQSVKDQEKLIIDNYTECSRDKIQTKLKAFDKDIKIISMKANRGIRLYFECTTPKALHVLRELVDSGELMVLIESWFNELTTNTDEKLENGGADDGQGSSEGADKPLIVKQLCLHDYCKCDDYFEHDSPSVVDESFTIFPDVINDKQFVDKQQECNTRLSPIENLTTDPLNMILLKSTILTIQNVQNASMIFKSAITANENLVSNCSTWRMNLMSVCSVWRTSGRRGSFLQKLISYRTYIQGSNSLRKPRREKAEGIGSVSICSRKSRRVSDRSGISDLSECEQVWDDLVKLDTCQRAVSGTAALWDKLFIACRHCHSIMVFSSKSPFAPLGEIPIDGMENPYDMAACPKNGCVYITDMTGAMFKMRYDGSHVDKLGIVVAQPHTLSVNEEGQVVILHNEYRPDRYGDGFNLFIKLCVYTSEEDTDKARYYTEKSPFSKKTIYLPPECTSVQHAVQVEPGHFFICYGKPSTVCQVSNGGSFESTSWKPAQHDSSPGHLSVNNDGNVYLTNRKQVILLSQKTLEEIPVVEEVRSIKNPTRITCLPRRRAMLIGTRTCAYVYDPESDDEE